MTLSLGARYGTGLYASLFALAALFSVFGPLGLAPLAATWGGLAWVAAPRSTLTKLVRAPEVWILAALAAWAAATMLWSPYRPGPEFEQLTAVKLALQLVFYGLLVAGVATVARGHPGALRAPVPPDFAGGSERVLATLAVAAGLWAALLAADGLSGGVAWAGLAGLVGEAPTLQFQAKKAAQGAYILAVLAWPAIAWLWSSGRRAPALLIAAGLVVGAAGLSAWSAALALLAGWAAWLLVVGLGRTGVWLLGAALALKTLLAPSGLLLAGGALAGLADGLPASWAHRVEIWTFAAERIAERPALGWGLDASRTFGLAIPLHPHDAPLQLWLELGALGAGLVAAVWLLLARRIAGLPERARRAAAATATSYFTVGALSFGVWQEWWLAVAALAWAACAVLTVSEDERQRSAPQGF